jgi:hypothetical protein
MHFTIEHKRLVKMLKSVRRKLPGQKKKDKEVRLYACADALLPAILDRAFKGEL